MKCTCAIEPNTLAPLICRDCWEVVIDRPRRHGAAGAAANYAKLDRRARIVQGDHYARPMPSKEYVYQVLVGRETV